MLQVTSRNQLAKIRYQARKRGLKIRADGTGNFSVICVRTEPPRPLLGADHQPLWVVEQVVCAPLPEPPPRRRRMARPAKPAPAAEVMAPAEVEARQAHHLVEASFRRLVDLLKARGGVL
jgi:hypothetical protein